MRVFVTGASGHIGSAVVPELLSAGHEVVGLARSDASAGALARPGAEVVRADLDDLDALADAAIAADGVIHLAFKHEAMLAGDMATAVAADLAALQAIGDALAGTGKPLVSTSGTLMLVFAGLGRPATEEDVLEAGPRVDAENAVVGFAAQGVRSSVVRLPPTVHSALDQHGFIPSLLTIAREKGVAAYAAEGENRWPAAHTLDVARLYRLALESAPAGSRWHAVADEGIPFRRIAESMGRRLGLPVVSLPLEQAPEHFGYLGVLVALDNPTSSARTRALLGWEPAQPGLIDDLELAHYFALAD